jgi:hypothetical protein
MIKISYSRESSYLRCPYQHYLGYIRRLSQKKPVRPLCFGGDFHKLLEKRGSPEELAVAKKAIDESYYALKPEWQADLGEDYPQDLDLIFGDYQKVYTNELKPDVNEQVFNIMIGKFRGEPVIFTGKIDELYFNYDGTGKIVIGEHKTFSRKPDLEALVMNTQKCLYAKAVQLLHKVRPDRLLWDYIKSAPSEQPIWLDKSQRFSNAKSDKITPFSWARACEARGITDPAILAQGESYKDNISNFFFRYPLDLVPEMVDNIFDGFKYTCRLIVKHGNRNRTKNMTRDCGWCGFHDICHAELTGGNVDYVIEKDYTTRPVQEDDTPIIEGVE